MIGLADSGLAQTKDGSFLHVDGGQLYYEVAGEGETVVFLHDGLTHGEIWDSQFGRLAAGHRVVRYDRRGHGRSDAASAPYSPLDDLASLMDRLEIRRAVLVGASSGGRLALDFALAFPARVDGLVLVGPVVSGFGYSDHFRERGRRNMAPLAEGNVEETVENWVGDPYLIAPGNARARERLRALLELHARKRLVEHRPELARAPDAPALGRLAEIDVPTLMVVGAEDVPDVHAHAGAIGARIESSRRVVVPGAGHLVALERPVELTKLLLDFLESRLGSR